jgi:excinuclease ABC subunit C
VAASFHFEHSVAFSSQNSAEILRGIPALPGVFALHGPNPADEPYLTRAADLRRRIVRMLAPPEPPTEGKPQQSKRLNLRERVARIEFTVTGSEFESALCLYHATAAIFGLERARRRLKLRTPYFLRFTEENAHPRVYSTNRLSKRALDNLYGPFPSRAAAERYCDAVLDLFKLRRCYEDLQPFAEHPGCVYQEMKKCLAPCNQAHAAAGAQAYAAEAAAVKRFFDTRGESMIVAIGLEREEASAAMEFEQAASLHTQWHKVKAAQALADELVQPVPKLRAVITQRAVAAAEETSPEAAIFLLHAGCISGPERLSTLGVRAVKEQTSVGSSLFAQPLMLQAVPLDEPVQSRTNPQRGEQESIPADIATAPPEETVVALNPEERAAGVLERLQEKASAPVDMATLSDHLSLLRRWYYRPEKQRAGEIFFPDANGVWPLRRILRGAARMALGDPKPLAETQRDLAQRNPAEPELKPARTKILHAGREGVERVVPVVEKRGRSRREVSGAADAQQLISENDTLLN